MIELMVVVALVHLVCCPFTKVEESFNLQAAHDVLYHKANISQYDHLEFPGVVPRTFLGPLFIALLSSPIAAVIQYLDLSKFWAQYLVRSVLGLTVIAAFHKNSSFLKLIFGKKWYIWYMMASVSQYHFMYYITRPLPNVMALPLVLLAIEGWLRSKNKQFIYCSAAAIIIFRSELALFLGLLLLQSLYNRKISVLGLLKLAIPAGIGCLALTVAVDSVFWQRLLWPEGEVLWFNVVLNKSSDYGTSPFFWYFYSAIPRGLAASLFLVPIGLYFDMRVRSIMVPTMLFVLLYSFLPHKELRFIIYVFPLLNFPVASACHKLWENRAKSNFQYLLAVGAAGHIIVNAMFTVFMLNVASTNYPGGSAMLKFHALVDAKQPVYLHIDNLAAQTGVSKFTHTNNGWRYSKNESIEPGSPDMLVFTHLLTEAKSKYSANLKPYSKTHNIMDVVEGFSHIAFNYKSLPPLKVKTKPMIYILQRLDSTAAEEPQKEAPATQKRHRRSGNHVEAAVLKPSRSFGKIIEKIKGADSSNDVWRKDDLLSVDKADKLDSHQDDTVDEAVASSSGSKTDDVKTVYHELPTYEHSYRREARHLALDRLRSLNLGRWKKKAVYEWSGRKTAKKDWLPRLSAHNPSPEIEGSIAPEIAVENHRYGSEFSTRNEHSTTPKNKAQSTESLHEDSMQYTNVTTIVKQTNFTTAQSKPQINKNRIETLVGNEETSATRVTDSQIPLPTETDVESGESPLRTNTESEYYFGTTTKVIEKHYPHRNISNDWKLGTNHVKVESNTLTSENKLLTAKKGIAKQESSVAPNTKSEHHYGTTTKVIEQRYPHSNIWNDKKLETDHVKVESSTPTSKNEPPTTKKGIAKQESSAAFNTKSKHQSRTTTKGIEQRSIHINIWNDVKLGADHVKVQLSGPIPKDEPPPTKKGIAKQESSVASNTKSEHQSGLTTEGIEQRSLHRYLSNDEKLGTDHVKVKSSTPTSKNEAPTAKKDIAKQESSVASNTKSEHQSGTTTKGIEQRYLHRNLSNDNKLETDHVKVESSTPTSKNEPPTTKKGIAKQESSVASKTKSEHHSGTTTKGTEQRSIHINIWNDVKLGADHVKVQLSGPIPKDEPPPTKKGIAKQESSVASNTKSEHQSGLTTEGIEQRSLHRNIANDEKLGNDHIKVESSTRTPKNEPLTTNKGIAKQESSVASNTKSEQHSETTTKGIDQRSSHRSISNDEKLGNDHIKVESSTPTPKNEPPTKNKGIAKQESSVASNTKSEHQSGTTTEGIEQRSLHRYLSNDEKLGTDHVKVKSGTPTSKNEPLTTKKGIAKQESSVASNTKSEHQSETTSKGIEKLSPHRNILNNEKLGTDHVKVESSTSTSKNEALTTKKGIAMQESSVTSNTKSEHQSGTTTKGIEKLSPHRNILNNEKLGTDHIKVESSTSTSKNEPLTTKKGIAMQESSVASNTKSEPQSVATTKGIEQHSLHRNISNDEKLGTDHVKVEIGTRTSKNEPLTTNKDIVKNEPSGMTNNHLDHQSETSTEEIKVFTKTNIGNGRRKSAAGFKVDSSRKSIEYVPQSIKRVAGKDVPYRAKVIKHKLQPSEEDQYPADPSLISYDSISDNDETDDYDFQNSVNKMEWRKALSKLPSPIKRHFRKIVGRVYESNVDTNKLREVSRNDVSEAKANIYKLINEIDDALNRAKELFDPYLTSSEVEEEVSDEDRAFYQDNSGLEGLLETNMIPSLKVNNIGIMQKGIGFRHIVSDIGRLVANILDDDDNAVLGNIGAIMDDLERVKDWVEQEVDSYPVNQELGGLAIIRELGAFDPNDSEEM